jgi:hypothetical protein
MMGRVGERVLVGLIKKDLEDDGKRVKLILKILQRQ